MKILFCIVQKKQGLSPPPAMNKEKFQIALINCCGVWVMSHFVYLYSEKVKWFFGGGVFFGARASTVFF